MIDSIAAGLRQDMEKKVQGGGGGWVIPVARGPNDLPAKNTPHPWKAWAEPLILKNSASQQLPCIYVRFSADKQPGAFFQLAMETAWQRAQARGWQLYEVDTVHQILPD